MRFAAFSCSSCWYYFSDATDGVGRGVGGIRRNIEETLIQVHLQSSATSMEEQKCQIVKDLEEEKQVSF